LFGQKFLDASLRVYNKEVMNFAGWFLVEPISNYLLKTRKYFLT